jgi:crossover junction endodeoxyribonuclease RusA
MADNKINYEHLSHRIAEPLPQRFMVPPGCEPAGPGAISAWVAGLPAPQGSKRAYGAGRPGGKIRLVESSTRVKPWREDIRQAFLERHTDAHRVSWQDRQDSVGPVVVKIVFVMPRTKAMRDRPSVDFPMVQKPDVDKLGRAVLDALTSTNVLADDSQVVTLLTHKRRAEPGEPTGAMIHIEPVVARHLTLSDLADAVERRDPPVRRPAEPTPEYDTPETVAAKLRNVRTIMDSFSASLPPAAPDNVE